MHGPLTPPTDAYVRWRMCGRKAAYTSLSKANKAARKLSYDTSIYECPVCACWHLTTRKKLWRHR